MPAIQKRGVKGKILSPVILNNSTKQWRWKQTVMCENIRDDFALQGNLYSAYSANL